MCACNSKRETGVVDAHRTLRQFVHDRAAIGIFMLVAETIISMRMIWGAFLRADK
jgi:hypothetical protein